MLKHFVIFTFEDNFFKEEHFNEYVDAFSRIKEEYPKIKERDARKAANTPAFRPYTVPISITKANRKSPSGIARLCG